MTKRKFVVRRVPFDSARFLADIEDMDQVGYDLIACGTGKFADGDEAHHAVFRLRESGNG